MRTNKLSFITHTIFAYFSSSLAQAAFYWESFRFFLLFQPLFFPSEQQLFESFFLGSFQCLHHMAIKNQYEKINARKSMPNSYGEKYCIETISPAAMARAIAFQTKEFI